MDVQTIELRKISPDIIPLIRDLKDRESQEYDKLRAAIQEDGQKHPILVRRLTDEERQKVGEGVEFGILDGHHRYDIAQNTEGIDTVEAKVSEAPAGFVEDVKLALRLNDSNIPMTDIEKGRVISQVMDKTNKSVGEVGKLLFGVEKSMAYNYLKAYNKSQQSPMDGETKAKPTVPFQKKEFAQLLKGIPKSEADIDVSNPEAAGAQLRAIWKLEEQLKAYKDLLSKSDAVKKVANQLRADERRAHKDAETDNLVKEAKESLVHKSRDWERGYVLSVLIQETGLKRKVICEKLDIESSKGIAYLKAFQGYMDFMKFIEEKRKELLPEQSLELWEEAKIIFDIQTQHKSHQYMSEEKLYEIVFNKSSLYKFLHTAYSEHVRDELLKQIEEYEGDMSLLLAMVRNRIESEKTRMLDVYYLLDVFRALKKRTNIDSEAIINKFVDENKRDNIRRRWAEADERMQIEDAIEAARKNVEQQGEDKLSIEEKTDILFNILDRIYKDSEKRVYANEVLKYAGKIFPLWVDSYQGVPNRKGNEIPLDKYLLSQYRKHRKEVRSEIDTDMGAE